MQLRAVQSGTASGVSILRYFSWCSISDEQARPRTVVEAMHWQLGDPRDQQPPHLWPTWTRRSLMMIIKRMRWELSIGLHSLCFARFFANSEAGNSSQHVFRRAPWTIFLCPAGAETLSFFCCFWDALLRARYRDAKRQNKSSCKSCWKQVRPTRKQYGNIEHGAECNMWRLNDITWIRSLFPSSSHHVSCQDLATYLPT